MVAFHSKVDIGNRALQHCGADRMGTDGFNEDSKRAAEVSFSYDKLREAELRRNTWTFATKRTWLRAMDTNTLLIDPALWAPTTKYFRGSIVTDQNGDTWISTIPNNLNNDPLLTAYWEPYFGPLTVALYSATGSYGTGELVYTAAGDGTYRVYLSLQDNNADNPATVTAWSATAIYFKNQTVTFYPVWAIGTTYAQGAGVTSGGISYVSLTAGNIGHTPLGDGVHWLPLALTASNAVAAANWDASTAYTANTVVAFNGLLYLAIAANTGATPSSSPSSWVAVSGGVTYQSLIDVNTNNEPDLAPALWSSLTTYSAGQKVGGSDGFIYQSVGNGNVNHDPTTDNGANWTNTGVLNPWTTVFTGGTGSVGWLEIGGKEFPSGVALKTQNIVYPIGAGPSSQTFNRNVFKLPSSFLRIAPQNAKGSVIPLGGPRGYTYNDWNIENGYLITAEVGPIPFRFVANVTDVRIMDPMFCEGLAARIGLEVCQPITQSDARLNTIAQIYKKWMDDARTENAIEASYDDPPDDDFIAVRA